MKKTFTLASLFLAACLARAAEIVYFVVGPVGGRPLASETNTFLLPLSDPQHIKVARQLASAKGYRWVPPLAFDLVDVERPRFRIGVRSDGVNRAVWSPGEPLWSWHVKVFLGWTGGNAIPEYPYQFPQAVEDAVKIGTLLEDQELSVANCLVIGELNPPMVVYTERVKMMPTERHILYWTHDAFGENYALEWTPSLSPPGWQALKWEGDSVARYSPSIVELNVSPPRHGFYRLLGGP
jgi:hypothetical protein